MNARDDGQSQADQKSSTQCSRCCMALDRPDSRPSNGEQARAVDIGTKRKTDLYDIRAALKSKGLVQQCGDRWNVKSPVNPFVHKSTR